MEQNLAFKPIVSVSHRYFIWAIVILLVSGISLASYIMITGINYDYKLLLNSPVVTHRKN